MDDVVGAIPAHLMVGIWGTLAVVIAAGGDILVQIIGIVAVGVFVFASSFLLWHLLRLTLGARVSTSVERLGQDSGELGLEAYPEFVLMPEEYDERGGLIRLLARTAQGLYWMSRYLERAQHYCRLLRLQSEALVDRPVRDINFGWSRIYVSMGREPPAGEIVLTQSDNFTLADSFTLAGDNTFERTNPDSVWSCFSLGRENARQMRQSISAEMWSCLNLAYLRIQNLSIQENMEDVAGEFLGQC